MKKYYIKTFGCQMNESDSQRIASFLEKQRYQKSEKIENADLIMVNACSVRQTAIDRIFGLSKKFKNLKAKKILTGCVIKSDAPKFKRFFDEVMNIQKFLGKNYLHLKPKCPQNKSAYLPIMTGCDNFCSYCVVPYTRGREISRPTNKIIKEIKTLIKQGCKEIVLLGQNVNSYKSDIRSTKSETNSKTQIVEFPKLLKLISKIPGDFTIKFLTSHPKDFSEELINVIAESPKISKEIHLPVQSGNDEILRKMNRGYTVNQYLNLIEKIKKKIPDIKITTDVIVGFPGETEKQFQNTVKLFKEINYDMAFINKYSPRAGTIAYKLKGDVPLKEKKRRWKILNDMVNQSTSGRKKLIVVLGPTASGKSDLAVNLALQLRSGQAKKIGINGGEIISADSRQIYKEMDIGTGKIKKHEMKEIPHYLLGVVSPKKQFSVAEYRNLALEVIEKMYTKNKIPIICGGTGFYIRAIVDGLVIPAVEPNWKLRKELEKKTTEELFKELKKLDPRRAKNIDAKNRRRLIRAIEIIKKTGKPVPVLEFSARGGPACLAGRQASGWDVLYIGIKKSLPEIKKSIDKRIDKMIKAGLEKEVKNLVKKYGWTLVLKNTIGYSSFAKATEDKSEIINDIKLQTFQFAKRQLTWFKKYPGNKINWITNYKKAEELTEKFLNQ